MKTPKYNLFGRGLKLQMAIIVACQMAFILFGYDQGVFSGIVTNDNWRKTFGYPGSGLEGIIVSIYNLGAFSGTIVAFIFGEKMGRRLSMWVAMVWIIVGAILQCTSYSVAQIMVARYVTGIGTGIETSTVPMYQSELCDADVRGRLVSSEPLFVGVGIVISYFFDYGMRYVGGPVAWRVPIACQVVFAFVVIGLVFGLPESPRWLYYHGRNQEAMETMCDVWNSGPDGEKVIKMQEDILSTIELEKKHGEYKWSQILKRDRVQTGRRVLLAYGMQFMNQVGGINLVVYYVPSALQYNVGLSPNLSLVLGGSLLPTFTLDKMGRRRPMMWGSFGLAISMMMIAVLLSFHGRGYPEHISKPTSSASVAFFYTYMLVQALDTRGDNVLGPPGCAEVAFTVDHPLIFGATANCIPWVYVPEILPLHARAKGTAIGISSNWLWNFVIVMITPTLINKLNWKAYFIFMCTNLAFIPLVYFCYPETSNLSLEEVDYLFIKEGSHGIHKITGPSQPVRESFRAQSISDEEKRAERKASLSGSGIGGVTGTEHLEHEEIRDDEKSS